MSKPEYKAVFIGKSGSGKTTLINTLACHFKKKSYDDERVIAISQLITMQDQNGNKVEHVLRSNIPAFSSKQSDRLHNSELSQTQAANIYSFDLGDCIFTLIDTPGLGDSEGQDDSKISKIFSSIMQIGEYNVIILVQKGSDGKEDASMGYLISKLRQMLPKSCTENFIVCLTSVINPNKVDALKILEKMNIPLKYKFYFENDCIVPPKLLCDISHVALDSEEAEDITMVPKSFWKKNAKNAQSLIDVVKTMRPKSGEDFKILDLNRRVIVKLGYEKMNEIVNLTQKEELLKKQMKTMEEVVQKIKENEDFTKKETIIKMVERVTYKEYEEISIVPVEGGRHATTCMHCHKHCHNPCNLEFIPQAGSIDFKSCTALGGSDNCKQCGCHFVKHMHSKETTVKEKKLREIKNWEPVETKVDIVDEKKKRIHDQNEEIRQKLEIELAENKRATENGRAMKDSMYRKLAFMFQKEHQIAINSTNDYFVEYMQQLIKNAEVGSALAEDRAKIIKVLKENITNYKIQEDIIKSNPSALTPQERQEVEQLIKDSTEAYEQEIKELVQKYQASKQTYFAH